MAPTDNKRRDSMSREGLHHPMSNRSAKGRRAARVLALLTFQLLLLSLMPFLLSCQSQTVVAANAAYRFVDDLGAEVVLTHAPKNVVALSGSYAETWLLAGGTLAGVTSDALTEWTLDMPKDVANLGSLKEPNIEKLLSLSPDFVILSTEIDGHRKIDQRLKELGIPHASFRVEHFSDYLNMLRICTELTGQQALFQINGLDVKARVDATLADGKPAGKPSVLLIRAFSTGVKARKDDNMTGRMLAEFDCDNIALRQVSLLENLSIEVIIAEDPDYILVETMGADTGKALAALAQGLQSNPAWGRLSAVRNQRCIVLPKDLFHYKPNVKWDESYAYLAKIFHQ